jgi:cytochrome P450
MEQAALPQRPLTSVSSLPPGPRTPALAQALLYSRDPLGFLAGHQRRYGDIFTIRFPFFGRIVYVAAPDLVKAVFTGAPSVFHAGEANATVLEPALGPNSVLTLDDAPHMRQRKLLLPPFHGERVRRYGELIVEVTRREMETWPSGEPFAMRTHTQRITLAVIMRAVFGVDDEARLVRFERLIDDFARRVGAITSIPYLRRDLGRFSPWGRFVRSREALDEFIYEEIRLRRAEPGHEDRDDVLSLLLGARDDDGAAMGDEELRDELVTVLGAGHETTATGLAWAVERLVRNPEVLAKLRDSLAGGDEEYLNATVKETLRSRPVIVDVARKLTAATTIGGYELQAGTFVLPAIAALHYREDVFPEPEEFRPERFLDAKADNYAWIPFGGGVRRCIGAAFAEYEMRTILREFVERAELCAVDPKPERVKVRNITLAPARGARVRLERPLRRP